MFSVVSFTRPGYRCPPLSFQVRTPACVAQAPAGKPGLLTVEHPGALAAQVAGRAVVGALSFDGRTAALSTASALTVTPADGQTVPQRNPACWAWPGLKDGPVLRPSEEGYRNGVRAILTAINEGRVVKVVLGRTVEHQFGGPVPAESLTQALARRHPQARIYCCPLPGGDTLVGASPELLVARHGTVVRSHPLAGTVPRSASCADDEAAAKALLASAKDRREHAVVVEMIADTLAPYCSRLNVPSEPSLVATPTVWHLGTQLEGEVSDPQTTSLELAAALQPTPALCGMPQREALQLIDEMEPFERQWFGGAVGWNDANGDGEWTVAIRCACLHGYCATLFAGAGLVAGSDPDVELAETEAKLAALQDVLLEMADDSDERIA